MAQNEMQRFNRIQQNAAPSPQAQTNAHASAYGANAQHAAQLRNMASQTGTSLQAWLPENRHVPDTGSAMRFLLDENMRPGQLLNGGGGGGGMGMGMLGGGGGGGGRGRGGGGAGGPDLKSIGALMQSGILELLGSDLFKPQTLNTPQTEFDSSMFDVLRRRTQGAADKDRAHSNEAYDRLVSALQGGFSNAFTDPKARATRPDTSMAGLAKSQGVDPSAITAANAESSQAMQEGDAQFANLMRTLAANAEQGQRSRLSEAEMGRTFSDRSINAELMGLLTGVDARQMDAKREHTNRQQEIARQEAQYNAQQTQAMNMAKLQQIAPLLELLAQAGLPTTGLLEGIV